MSAYMKEVKGSDGLDLKIIQDSDNVAELLPKDRLYEIVSDAARGLEIDENSRSEWTETVNQAMGIAKQILEPKSFPWPGASNIKMPIITRACIDYASRTLPELIQNDKVVKASIVGADPNGEKKLRADRVSKCMSYQLVRKSPDWEEGTDKLLMVLPVLGTVFKKTYYSEVERRCISELCVPEKIVVNYGAQSLESARRVTHLYDMYTNDIIERQRLGIYSSDIDVELLQPAPEDDTDDCDRPIEVAEQHCYLDLDGDGYKEPYIVTFHKASEQIFRIVPRFEEVHYKGNEVLKIDPVHYFTDFHFIRSPDGGFYSMGFGQFLLPLNKAINSLTNQLIDSGTLANTQGGFYSNRLRARAGDIKVKMGVFQKIDAPGGMRLADQFYNLPFKEPSQTLFQLLGMLMQTAQDLSSTTDVLLGKQPAQNVASSTISQLIEQGTKVYTAVNKRYYRSQTKEYQKIYKINHHYLTNKEYQQILDDPKANVKSDFEPNTLDVFPIADPLLSSDQQRLIKANVVQQLRTIDPRAADSMVLDAIQVEEATKEKLLPPPDPNAPPPAEELKLQAEVQKLQAEVAEMAAKATLETEKLRLEMQMVLQNIEESKARSVESAARVQKMQKDAINNENKLQITARKMQYEEEIKAIEAARKFDEGKHSQTLKESEILNKSTENRIKQEEAKKKDAKPE